MSSGSWIEYSYSHFFARDIGYTFSGGLFICILEYSLLGEVFLPHSLSLELFGFIFSSYIIGIGLGGIFTTIKKFKIKLLINCINWFYEDKRKCPELYEHPLVFFQDLIKYYDVKIFNMRERNEYHRVVGLSLGATLILGGLLLFLRSLGVFIFLLYKAEYAVAFHTYYIIFVSVLATLAIISGWLGLKKVKELDAEILDNDNKLAEHIQKIKSQTIEY